MHGKDFFRNTAMSFFIIVTCVNVAAFVMGMIFDREASFGYEAFLSPLLFGVCGCIPNLLLYANHEMSVGELVVRKLLQLIVLEIGLTWIAFGGGSHHAADPKAILSFGFVVFAIFIAVHVISWLMDVRTARAMMMDLKEFQSKHSE